MASDVLVHCSPVELRLGGELSDLDAYITAPGWDQVMRGELRPAGCRLTGLTLRRPCGLADGGFPAADLAVSVSEWTVQTEMWTAFDAVGGKVQVSQSMWCALPADGAHRENESQGFHLAKTHSKRPITAPSRDNLEARTCLPPAAARSAHRCVNPC